MKKKKNMSYKALMAGITSGSGASQDMNKQREKIRSVTGGGTFTKIDKIWNIFWFSTLVVAVDAHNSDGNEELLFSSAVSKHFELRVDGTYSIIQSHH